MPAMNDELAFDDVQILKLESAAILGHTCKVVVIEPDDEGRPLDANQLRERIAERLDAVPRLRDRVEMPATGNPSWVADGDFDLRPRQSRGRRERRAAFRRRAARRRRRADGGAP
jgi:hypothetical protein